MVPQAQSSITDSDNGEVLVGWWDGSFSLMSTCQLWHIRKSVFGTHPFRGFLVHYIYTHRERERYLDKSEGIKFIFLKLSFLIWNINYNNNPNLSEACTLNRNIQGSFANWRLNSDANFKNLLCVCVTAFDAVSRIFYLSLLSLTCC